MKSKPDSKVKSTEEGYTSQRELLGLADVIIQSVNAGIYIVQHGRFVYVSTKFQELTGYKEKELLGTYSLDHVHPDDREMVRDMAIKSLKADSVHPYEYRYLRKSGDVLWVMEMVSSTIHQRERATLGIFMDITERKIAEERYRAVVRTTMDGFWVTDLQGRFLDVNDAYCNLIGYSRDELLNMSIQDVEAIDTSEDVAKRILDLKETGHAHFESRHHCKDGRIIDVDVSVSYLPIGQGSTFTFLRDITERKHMEEELKESEEMYRSLVELSPDMIVVSVEGKIAFVNSAAVKMVGASCPEQLIGRQSLDFIHPDYQKVAAERMRKATKTGQAMSPIEQKHIRLDGTAFDVEVTSTSIAYKGKPALQSVIRDITWRKQSEERLKFLATHDPLTSLPNRTLFTDRLMVALSQAGRHQQQLAVMMLDLDRFKFVNDILGHDMGDKLLIEVGNRLTSVLRKSDTVARMGGDEFVILLSQIAQAGYATAVAQKILRAFHTPFTFDGRDLNITTSIGITVHPGDGNDTAELLKNADVAMYRAKERGRDNYQLFSDIPSPM